jgi:signal transduction histidine kinase
MHLRGPVVTVVNVETGTPTARLTQWFRGVNPWVIDAWIGTIFTVLGLVGLLTTTSRTIDYHDVDALGVVLALGCSLPYYFRRRAPVSVLFVSTVCLCALSIIGYPSSVQSQMLLVGMYTVGSHSSGRGRLFGVASVLVGLAIVAAAGIPDASTSGLALAGATYVAFYLFGSTVRNRRLYLGELEARARELERERDEEAARAVAEERLRIAQELHDVVAHSMGVIAVQAGVGAHVIDTDPAEAKHSLEAISATSRSTLGEIRRILGVLRGDGAAEYQPAPGLADLDRLVADFDDAGLPVAVTVDGAATELPPGVDLTAYRIVQEALTNTLKHAGPAAHAEVTVSYRPGAVAVCVTDDGRGVNGTESDGGHGLLGMRERVAVYGGTLTAGPQRGGGFRVLAALPYGECE